MEAQIVENAVDRAASANLLAHAAVVEGLQRKVVQMAQVQRDVLTYRRFAP